MNSKNIVFIVDIKLAKKAITHLDVRLREYMSQCYHIIAPSESIRELLDRKYARAKRLSSPSLRVRRCRKCTLAGAGVIIQSLHRLRSRLCPR